MGNSAAGGCITLFTRATEEHDHFMDLRILPARRGTCKHTAYICLSVVPLWARSLSPLLVLRNASRLLLSSSFFLTDLLQPSGYL